MDQYATAQALATLDGEIKVLFAKVEALSARNIALTSQVDRLQKVVLEENAVIHNVRKVVKKHIMQEADATYPIEIKDW